MKTQDLLAEQFDECASDAAFYALGALPPEQANAVEQRLRSGCSFCSAQVEHYAAVAEQLACSVPLVEPRPELRQQILDRVRAQTALSESTPQRKVVRGHDAPWIKLPIPGVETRALIGDKTFLVRMQAGAIFPEHDHPQAEQCYVLEGSITDSDGLTLHAGDFVVMSRGIEHKPIHSVSGCTLFIAYAD